MITRNEAIQMIQALCSRGTRHERLMLGGILWHLDRKHSVEKIMSGEKYKALPANLKPSVDYVLTGIEEN